jgi:DNA end-binding protein Ku
LPKPSKAERENSGAFWSGTITFGLVSVPVDLFPANKSSHIGLRTLAPDGTPLRRQYVSSETGRELSPRALARGYDVGKGRYVLVTDDELERLAPEKSHDIDLRLFVDRNQIDPIYSERGYFLAPAGDSAKAYHLLAAVLETTRRAGIATFVMRGKEYLISIVAEGGILRAETMRFKDEIRSPSEVGLPEKAVAPKELTQRFERIIEQKAASRLPEDALHDRTSEALLKIVKSKYAHKQGLVVRPVSEGVDEGTAPDLMAALRKSLMSGHGRPRKKPTLRKPRHFSAARSRRDARTRRAR